MQEDTDTALSVLQEAMRNELDGQEMYIQAAERTQDRLGKSMFRSFVQEEEQHLHVLQVQYAKLCECGQWVDIDTAKREPRDSELALFPQEEREIKNLIPEDATDLEALKIAMDFERYAVRMYKKAAAESENETAQAFYQDLAKWESSHYAILDKSYNYLASKGEWYFQEEEKHFYEG